MPLSDHEQQILEQIARGLEAEPPPPRATRGRVHHTRFGVLASAGVLVMGFFVLYLGLRIAGGEQVPRILRNIGIGIGVGAWGLILSACCTLTRRALDAVRSRRHPFHDA